MVISSTVFDLTNERTAAYDAVNRVGGFPVMSEKTMEAQSTNSLTSCLSKVTESEIYVLILGLYCWQPEGKESITELEYQTARSKGLTVIVINTNYAKEDLQKEFERRVLRKTKNECAIKQMKLILKVLKLSFL